MSRYIPYYIRNRAIRTLPIFITSSRMYSSDIFVQESVKFL